MTGQGLLREGRAAVFTLVCVGVAAVLHTWADGSAPSPLALMAGFGLVLGLSLLLTGRERGFGEIAVMLLAAEAGLHYLFVAVPTGHSMSHVMAGAEAHASMATTQPTDGLMVFAHVVAAVIAAGWLRGGEAAAWRLCRWLTGAILPVRIAPAVVRIVIPSASQREGLRFLNESPLPVARPDCRHSVILRGPPRAASLRWSAA
jgi:hypothetical protein